MNSYTIYLRTPEYEFKNIEKYLILCSDEESNTLQFSKKIHNPKVSIISPVFNRGKYLLRFLKSILYQNFKDIEIILIDDCSSDDSANLIKQYQNKIQNIILIKNKRNYGTFKSRNLGIIASSGDYVILPDPDDILSQNSLKMFYNFAIKYNYEMIRFNLYIGNNRFFLSNIVNRIQSRPVFPPQIQTLPYYATGKLEYIDVNVSNKFIKREALIRALNILGKDYLNIYMTTFEDQLLNFVLHRTTKSFYFLKKVGYYYIKNQFSITNKGFSSKDIKNIFLNLRILFNYSKNNRFEKNMFNLFFKNFVIRNSIINKINLKDDIIFYIDNIDLFVCNEFISINNKNYMIELKNKLETILYEISFV